MPPDPPSLDMVLHTIISRHLMKNPLIVLSLQFHHSVISTDIVIQQRIQFDQDNTDSSTRDDTTQRGLNVLHNSNNIS